jgi:20S proteasome subunit beta 3
MYTIKEEREITAVTFAHLVSSTLYERRFGPYFIEPVVAGLEPIPMPGAAEAAATSAAEGGEGEGATGGEKAKRRYEPFIASTDLIGYINWAKVRLSLMTNYHLPTWMVDVVGAGCGLQLMKVYLIV